LCRYDEAAPTFGCLEVWRIITGGGGWHHPVHLHLIDGWELGRAIYDSFIRSFVPEISLGLYRQSMVLLVMVLLVTRHSCFNIGRANLLNAWLSAW
jgi:hypothetical protein